MAQQQGKNSGQEDDADEGAAQEPEGAAKKLKDSAGAATDTAQKAGSKATGQTGDGSSSDLTVSQELRSIAREAAIDVLGPVVRKATTEAAKYAVTKGPTLATKTVLPKLKEVVGPKLEEAGGAGNLAKGVLSSATGGGGGLVGKLAGGLLSKGGKDGGGPPSGTGRGRRLPVQEHVDVGVPLETAYEEFSLEDFPTYMHRVENVEWEDDTHVSWEENIWGVRRKGEAEITDQRPNERVAWKSVSGTQTTGVVTFHRLSDRLTRIQINLDFQPKGLMEKTASGFRMSRRAVLSDLMRFKAKVEMRNPDEDEASGEQEDEERTGEEAEDRTEPAAEEEDEGEQEEPEEDEEDEEDEEQEPEAEDEQEPEAEDEQEREEKPRARPHRTRRRASEAEEEPEEGQKKPRTRAGGQSRRRAPASPTRRRRVS